MKNYCYICLLTACMAPMSLQAQKAIPYSGEVCVAPLPTVPTTLPGISSDSYARRFADSEMLRFPKAYQLDHGKRLFFGYSQGVGCCACWICGKIPVTNVTLRMLRNGRIV